MLLEQGEENGKEEEEGEGEGSLSTGAGGSAEIPELEKQFAAMPSPSKREAQPPRPPAKEKPIVLV